MRSPRGLQHALALLALASGLGCHADPDPAYFGNTDRGARDPATLYINSGGEPDTLDPAKSTDALSAELIPHLFEGLFAYGPDLRPVQGVAHAWERTGDGLVYRFHLRPEARWSDGRPVTAHDFEYAWRRALRPETGSRSATDLYPIRNAEPFNRGQLKDEAQLGVRALDDLTLEVALERATPWFPSLACRPVFAPVRRDVIEDAERRGEPEPWVRPEGIVANGPYTLESWRLRYEIVMKANDQFWAHESLKTRRVVWIEADSAQSAMNLYRTAEIDGLGGGAPPPEYIARVAPTRDLRKFPLLGVYWYDINTRAPPLDDVRVRRALDLALDKQLILESAGGGGLPTAHYVPEITAGGYAEALAAARAAGGDPFPEAGPDLERARALLAEAGHPVSTDSDDLHARGFPTLEILYPAGDTGSQRVAVSVQALWRQHLGVRAAIRAEEWRVMMTSVRSGHFQMAASVWFADYNHPHTFLETFASTSPHNATGWTDAEYDRLLSEATRAADPEESARLYLRAEQRALAGESRIPLFFPLGMTLLKPWVKGFPGNGRGMHLARWLWVDPEWRAHPADVPAGVPLELPPPGRIEPP